MTLNDLLKTRRFERSFLDELQQASFVFCTARFQCDGGEVFGGKDSGANAFDIASVACSSASSTSGLIGGRNCTGHPAIMTGFGVTIGFWGSA